LREIPSSSGLAPGQVAWAKMAKNLLHWWHHSQKNQIFFFIAISTTCWVFWGFEHSPAQSVEELWSW